MLIRSHPGKTRRGSGSVVAVACENTVDLNQAWFQTRYCTMPGMKREPDAPEKVPTSPEDDARTREAKRVVEEYANALRVALQKLRRWFH